MNTPNLLANLVGKQSEDGTQELEGRREEKNTLGEV